MDTSWISFLGRCEQLGIRFQLEQGQLKTSAPRGVLQGELLAELRERKAQIKSWLERLASDGASSSSDFTGIEAQLRPVVATGEAAPLSFGQEALWLAYEAQRRHPGLHFCARIECAGALDEQALETALRALCARHQVLESSMEVSATGLVQRAGQTPFKALARLSTQGQEAVLRDAALQGLREQVFLAPFDLAKDCKLRGALVRLDAQTHELWLAFHHAASDGWSLGVFVQELRRLYELAHAGHSAVLEPLPLQYADFAVWERSELHQAQRAQDLAYWQEALADAPEVHGLRVNRERALGSEGQVLTFQRLLPAERLEQVRAMARQAGTTEFVVLHTLLALAVGMHSNARDVVIGTPLAVRPSSRLDGLVGYFVNLLPLRLRFDLKNSFIHELKLATAGFQQAVAHAALPFAQIVERLMPARSAGIAPLVQICLSYQNQELPAFSLRGLACRATQLEQGFSQYELELDIRAAEQGLALNWRFAHGLFEAAVVHRLADTFELALQTLLDRPTDAMGALRWVSAAEQSQLQRFNATTRSFPQHVRIHELFEAQAQRAPDAVALRFEGQSLSYRELDAQSNRVAQYLVQSCGVQRNELVGLCMERSLEMVVGLLGILKAGAAYVPLDPSYPAQRLAHMVQDSGARKVLMQQRLLGQVPVAEDQALCLDTPQVQAQLAACESTQPVVAGASSEDLAY
uniref:condensation domain-containing protein n=1 Tax=Pelomonas sp. BJYL3 TaxID=2976697 RepID=UPI0022B5C20E